MDSDVPGLLRTAAVSSCHRNSRNCPIPNCNRNFEDFAVPSLCVLCVCIRFASLYPLHVGGVLLMMLAASTFCQCPGCPGGTGPAYGTSPEVLMLYKPEKIRFKDY